MIHVNYTFSELIESFKDAIVGNETLKRYCEDNFNRQPAFALGNDERREWGLEDAPFLVMVPTGFNGGITVGQVVFSFDIDIGIEDSVFEDYEHEDVTVMRGFRSLDGLVNVVMDIIGNHAGSYNAIGDQINVSYNDSEFFPLHVASLNVDVEVPTVMNARNTL